MVVDIETGTCVERLCRCDFGYPLVGAACAVHDSVGCATECSKTMVSSAFEMQNAKKPLISNTLYIIECANVGVEGQWYFHNGMVVSEADPSLCLNAYGMYQSQYDKEDGFPLYAATCVPNNFLRYFPTMWLL